MTQDQIIEALLAFIAADGATEGAFNALALDLFAYQFENNPPFRRFSMQVWRWLLHALLPGYDNRSVATRAGDRG